MADRRLQVFCAAARELSFTRAGEVLYLTQPAVSFQVTQLEKALDVRLFERLHNRIHLTADGAGGTRTGARATAGDTADYPGPRRK